MTTHWEDIRELKQCFPHLNVQENAHPQTQKSAKHIVVQTGHFHTREVMIRGTRGNLTDVSAMQDAVISDQSDIIFHAGECAAGIGH